MQNQVEDSSTVAGSRFQSDADPMSIALVMMPFLGGSSEEWAEVMNALAPKMRCIGLDLPGFGDAAETKGYSVAEMAAYVSSQVEELKLQRFMLVGHSMAGKVAMVVASQAKNRPGLSGLSGLVLVASSPLSPEPMSEDKRAEMKANLGRPGANYRKHAEEFIRKNISSELPAPVFRRAVGDVMRMNCQAWMAWLDSGSKEDWSERVGELNFDSLVVAGEDDEALGALTQEKFVMPHLPKGKLSVVSGSGHLIPMEQPLPLARLITTFVSRSASARSLPPISELDPGYRALIESDRVSSKTRAALLGRLGPVEGPSSEGGLSYEAVGTLQALAERVAPMTGRSLDFGVRIHARLSSGEGKGWRYAELPTDVEAYRAAIKTVDLFCMNTFDLSFVNLREEDQIQTLMLLQRGELNTTLSESDFDFSVLDASQMQRWFEDLRGDVSALYMSHPETLAELGYSGIADGANSASLFGFVELGLGKVEPWEPAARGTTQ